METLFRGPPQRPANKILLGAQENLRDWKPYYAGPPNAPPIRFFWTSRRILLTRTHYMYITYDFPFRNCILTRKWFYRNQIGHKKRRIINSLYYRGMRIFFTFLLPMVPKITTHPHTPLRIIKNGENDAQNSDQITASQMSDFLILMWHGVCRNFGYHRFVSNIKKSSDIKELKNY